LIKYIKGLVVKKESDCLILDNNGIGYKIFCSSRELSQINTGSEATIYTYLVHKEDNMTLFGFVKEKNLEGFEYLLKVDGVGPKLALKILSFYDIDEVYSAIESENIEKLKKVPGLGPKMVNKLLFELKGKLPDTFINDTPDNDFNRDIISALLNFGYQESDIRAALNKYKPETQDFQTEFKKYIKILAKKL
jgi:Holliday junction DNA helicase RuvA